MTAGIDILLEGVILVVSGTGIMVEGMTVALKHLAQIHRLAMGAVMAATMASVQAATVVMDSQTLTIKQEPSQARATSRPSSLFLVRMAHRPVQVTHRSPFHKHRLLNSTPHHWCPTPCLLSSPSKHPTPKK